MYDACEIANALEFIEKEGVDEGVEVLLRRLEERKGEVVEEIGEDGYTKRW